MNEYLIIFIFILWYVLSMVISEGLGKKKKLGIEWSFFLCIMLSPVVGYVILKLSRDK
jgi:hypothetical protein